MKTFNEFLDSKNEAFFSKGQQGDMSSINAALQTLNTTVQNINNPDLKEKVAPTVNQFGNTLKNILAMWYKQQQDLGLAMVNPQ